MYQSPPKEHVKSRISPGTIIRFSTSRNSWPREWFYAIHLYESQFYVIRWRHQPARIMTLADHTLLRAHLDNRLEIIEQ